MVLRRMTGNYVKLGPYNVSLPTENDILAWTRVSCKKHAVVMPIHYHSPTGDKNVALVQDIAASCITEMGAVILCSAYRIPEIDMHHVHDRLITDAERFVFYTIVAQDYPTPTIREARKRLQPKFGNRVISLDDYAKNARLYTDSTIDDRLASYTEPIVRPSEMNEELNVCPPYSCPELYRFANEQLRELASTGDTELTREQLAAFVTLCVQS